MKVVKAAAVQLNPVLYSREGTVDKVVRKIHELGQQGVQFATFPETVVPYYPHFSFLQPAYQIVGGREHLELLDQAVTVPSEATHAVGHHRVARQRVCNTPSRPAGQCGPPAGLVTEGFSS
jgi:nitrilase